MRIGVPREEVSMIGRFSVAFLLLALPAFAQSRVYTNADLDKIPRTRTVTEEELAALRANQFVAVPERSGPVGIILGGSTHEGPFGPFYMPVNGPLDPYYYGSQPYGACCAWDHYYTRGPVRVTAPLDLGVQALPGIVQRIIERYPGIVIELVLTSRRVDLVEEGIDLAIRGGQLPDSALVSRKIAATDLGIFAAPSYLQRRGRPRTFAELARHDCLAYGGRRGKFPWRLTGPDGEETVSVSGPVVCDDMLFLRELVLAGMGLTLLPVQTVAADVRAGRLVRVLPRYRLAGGGLFLLWPSRTLVPPRVVAVRELLAEELGKLM